MQIVYYFEPSLRFCPAKAFLQQYDSKIRAMVYEKIKYVLENQGMPSPPIVKLLHGYGFLEIRNRKDRNTVIRIFFFRYKDFIVLLNALEKPDAYDDKKTRCQIDRQLDLTEQYLNNFKSNPYLYENYTAT